MAAGVRGSLPTARVGRALCWAVGALAGTAAAVALLEAMAVAVVAGNSDGTTVVLEGQSIESGHVLLHGWMLSLDSFWTIDALFNAIGVAAVGVEPQLLRAVPIAIAICVIAVGLVTSTRGQVGRGRWCAAAVVVAVLALPPRPLALFFLASPYHVGTALYCLVGFGAFARGRYGWRWTLGVVVLAAAIVGDYQAFLLGVAPVIAVGLLDGHREHSLRATGPLIGGGVCATALALVVRALARAAGGYRLTKANTHASGGQIVRNVAHLPNEALSLLGLTTGPFGATGVPIVLDVLHLVVVAVIGVALVAAGRRMAIELDHRPDRPVVATRRFEDLLVLGIIGDLIAFVFLPITTSDAYTRYLTAGVIYAAILTARVVGGWSTRAPSPTRPLALACVIGAVAISTYGFSLGGPATNQPAVALSSYLAQHHLDEGVGDYWSASIVTVESQGAVEVRPVIAAGPRLVRYNKQSAASWYSGVAFSFYVYDKSLDWNGDNRAVGVRTFGRPVRTVAIGPYRVLIFSGDRFVSVVGSEGA